MGTDSMIQVKRAYEPASRSDGQRILVERLWPRGMTKEALEADAWMKEVAPSTGLRIWFGHRPERWQEFRRRYERELSANQQAWEPLVEASKRGTVTLLYSARDTLHNAAVALREYLIRRRNRRAAVREQTPRMRGKARVRPAESAARPSSQRRAR